ncbi:universal stress protein [Streptomyces sp. ME19-01-6]|uniref:universal stress protein n=1 Tax=Streptomyces sp. ME19-01-6 TaxID=3028686 RepID=UPI0029BF966D|nr:universal stress protein [Streptomyces sp. ME19-01-6]MDX3227112.1 universal stress protein [Streptomyces sp. ME19-01-6]
MNGGPVVAGVDGSEHSLAAADRAAREALDRAVPLLLLHASPPLPPRISPVPGADAWGHVGEQMIRRAAADLADRHPGLEVTGEHVAAAADEALLTAAGTAGLMVVGARGWGGFDGLAVGSVALRVTTAADCPVLTVPERPEAGQDAGGEATGREAAVGEGAEATGREAAVGEGAEVVAALDAHGHLTETAEFAFRAALAHQARLRVVHAWELPAAAPSAWMIGVLEEDRGMWEDQEGQAVSDALRPWRRRYPQVEVLPDVVLLNPAQALVSSSARALLLVVGRRTADRVAERHLGPVAHAVLHHAHCPVAVVPHPLF